MSKVFKKAGAVTLIAAAIAPLFAHAAASTTLYGGGATLPAIAYVGSSFFSSPTQSRQTDPADAGSLFGSYSALTGKPMISYCQTGSGTGRKVIDGVQDASVACGTFVDGASTRGFSALGGAGGLISNANFAASDAPLSQTEYTTFITNKGNSAVVEPVQVPMIAGAIAVVYNNANVTSQINLTDSQVCQIFNGTINNWSQLGFPSKPITVVYRSDGSGTSFYFSNHLAAVCGAFAAGPYAGDHFNANSTFGSAIANSSGVSQVLPSNWVAASGNPAVVTAVAATDGSIAYGEVADAVARSSAIGIAKINGKDPRSNLKATFSLASGTLQTDQVLGTDDPTTGKPTLVAISPAATHAGCVLIADPNKFATSTTNYPIVAVTYLLGYYAGNGDDKANLQALFLAPTNFSVKSKTTTIGSGTGFAYLGGTGVSTAVKNAVKACINN